MVMPGLPDIRRINRYLSGHNEKPLAGFQIIGAAHRFKPAFSTEYAMDEIMVTDSRTEPMAARTSFPAALMHTQAFLRFFLPAKIIK